VQRKPGLRGFPFSWAASNFKHGALRLGVGNDVSTINAGDRHEVAARFA